MTDADGTAALKQRLKSAEADCQAWRSTGLAEKYMEAYDLVEALQTQLSLRLHPPCASVLTTPATNT